MVAGRGGRLNFFWEPIAAGNGGAEKTAATQLILLIQVCISSWLLEEKTHIKHLLTQPPLPLSYPSTGTFKVRVRRVEQVLESAESSVF